MAVIIGNRLDSSNKKVLDRMTKKDFEFVRREAQAQMELGAGYIEINATFLLHHEWDFLQGALQMVEELGGRAMLVSQDINIIREALKLSRNEMIVGNFEYNPDLLLTILDLVKEKNAKIVAQVKTNNQHSISPEQSLYIALQYIDFLLDNGVRREDILLNPVVMPIDADYYNGRVYLDTLELFKLDFPQISTIADISNFCEGLPRKNLLTAFFLSLALSRGLDYVVTNILDGNTGEAVSATLALTGRDRNLMNYKKFCQQQRKQKEKE